jgi:hypothetical protein
MLVEITVQVQRQCWISMLAIMSLTLLLHQLAGGKGLCLAGGLGTVTCDSSCSEQHQSSHSDALAAL